MGLEVASQEVARTVDDQGRGGPFFAVAFDQSGDGVDLVLFGKGEELLYVGVLEGDVAAQNVLRKHDQIGAIFGGLLEEGGHALNDRIGVALVGQLHQGNLGLVFEAQGRSAR